MVSGVEILELGKATTSNFTLRLTSATVEIVAQAADLLAAVDGDRDLRRTTARGRILDPEGQLGKSLRFGFYILQGEAGRLLGQLGQAAFRRARHLERGGQAGQVFHQDGIERPATGHYQFPRAAGGEIGRCAESARNALAGEAGGELRGDSAFASAGVGKFRQRGLSRVGERAGPRAGEHCPAGTIRRGGFFASGNRIIVAADVSPL